MAWTLKTVSKQPEMFGIDDIIEGSCGPFLATDVWSERSYTCVNSVLSVDKRVLFD